MNDLNSKSIEDEDARLELVHTLLNDESYHIEFNGHLTNHDKHAVVALHGIGASSKRIKAYYENYAELTPYGYGLEPARASTVVMTDLNWQNYLGKRSNYSAYCEYFDKKEKELGLSKLLNLYLPILIPGWCGAFTHATIHLGWGLDVQNKWMCIEGLAYMAFSYVSCYPERTFTVASSVDSTNTVVDSLLTIAGVWEENSKLLRSYIEELQETSSTDLHPELVRSGLQFRIAKMLSTGHPLLYATPSWIDDLDIPSIWQQLRYSVTLMYLAAPGDFIILHYLTALHAMEFIAAQLPQTEQRNAIKCFWIGMLGIQFSRAEFPTRVVLEKLHRTHQYLRDDQQSPASGASWEDITARAITEDEEHNPKLVYVLQRMWRLSNYRSVFRIAANLFTTTPELPKSFETPPTE